ncbi:hypothetical protein [Brasilonema sp. UFV-L1]|uniref:hypothetical protein n=1 Tax=Brasilonema sp. UFV-L1 TaxID=2234130 RepID=UPI00145F18BA|nr:hypothetical protein [Brasilonema sp. UFV-L1]NMG08996.1 hypothetical protein [Brasilonema sp. UFV-L1]
MKFIVALSSLALFSLSSVSPCLAASQSISPSADQSLSSQFLPSAAKTIQVAQTFGSVTQVINTVDREIRNRERARQRQERLDIYRQRSEERQRKLEASREAARQRREAARQRREAYLQSLTPQQREEFLAAERERNARMLTIYGDILKKTAPMWGNGGSSTGTGSRSQLENCYNDQGQMKCWRE